LLIKKEERKEKKEAEKLQKLKKLGASMFKSGNLRS
jgi:hypothetical protein